MKSLQKRCLFSRLNTSSFFSPSVHILCSRPDHLSDLSLDLFPLVNKRQTRRCLNKSQIKGKDGATPWASQLHYYKSWPGCSLSPAPRAHCWFMLNFFTMILTGFPAKSIKLNSSGKVCIIQFQKQQIPHKIDHGYTKYLEKTSTICQLRRVFNRQQIQNFKSLYGHFRLQFFMSCHLMQSIALSNILIYTQYRNQHCSYILYFLITELWYFI